MVITLKQNAAGTEVSRLRGELGGKRLHYPSCRRRSLQHLRVLSATLHPRCSPNRVPRFRR